MVRFPGLDPNLISSYFRGILKAAQILYQKRREGSTSPYTTSPDMDIFTSTSPEEVYDELSAQEDTTQANPYLEDPDPDFYWLASDGWGKQKGVVKQIEDFAVGAITVELESKTIGGFDDYMKTLTPEDNERNLW